MNKLKIAVAGVSLICGLILGFKVPVSVTITRGNKE